MAGKSKVQVMKFGGTSVGDASCIARAAQIVAQAARENAVAAVVSAMSGVTNRLVEAANRAGSGDREAGSALIVELRRQHAAALAALVSDETRRAAASRAHASRAGCHFQPWRALVRAGFHQRGCRVGGEESRHRRHGIDRD